MIPAISPQRVSAIENSALSAATTTSHAATIPVPPPKQPPCTSATVGTGSSFSRRTASAVAREARSFSSPDSPATRRIHFRSAPAWKCFPAPRSTTARTPPRAPSASIASSRPWITDSS